MLDRTAIVKLKRSVSDGDHLIPMGDVTPPQSPGKETPASKTRPGRSFSVLKLTDTPKGRRRSSSHSSRSSRPPSIDKSEISAPILDPRSPLCPPTPKSPIFTIFPSPPLPNRPAAHSNPGPFRPLCFASTSSHFHSISDPTNRTSLCRRGSLSDRPPPLLPVATSFESTLVEGPLERIVESPYEPHEECASRSLAHDNSYGYLKAMEPVRLQPPNMGGTKGRAMQQARDMEALVAERAKRSGEEPPPYDFYELIGKGAYGRVFKGSVCQCVVEYVC